MRRTLRLVFLTTEINLILWLVAVGAVLSGGTAVVNIRTTVVVGFLFAAIAQHWAYYAAYRRAKQM